jgi:hypothetical protein
MRAVVEDLRSKTTPLSRSREGGPAAARRVSVALA